MKKIDIAYIGSNYNFANTLNLSKNFNLIVILCEKSRINKDIILFSSINEIPIIFIENKKDLENAVLKFRGIVQNYIIYNFGIIIPENLVQKINFYNIHPGSLKFNRGRNPVEWALLKNHKFIEISLYKIHGGIDLGILINSIKISIDIYDNNLTLNEKINKEFFKLIRNLFMYINNYIQGEEIKKGIYYKPVTKKDYTIDLKKDSLKEIYNKIRSQKKYNGAILNLDKRIYYITDLVNVELNENFTKEYELNEKFITVYKKYKITLKYTIN